MLVRGSVVLLLSFPVYLLLDGNTKMWRTQMLLEYGAGGELSILPFVPDSLMHTGAAGGHSPERVISQTLPLAENLRRFYR